jgi:hypothetical protein
MAKSTSKQSGHKLVVSKQTSPHVALPLKAGMRFEVVSLTTVNEKFNPQKVGARLCGGSGTCLAIVDVSGQKITPSPGRKG